MTTKNILKKATATCGLALMCSATAFADVVINETNFPDKNFRDYLLSESYGSDGVLTDAEIAGITTIYVNNKSISDLSGIQFFTALTKLECYHNQLTTLDVSANAALTSLRCDNNQLTTLNVSANTALTYLECGYNQLNTLDISKNTALRTLYCFDNQLTTLDVSKNTALKGLECDRNQLTTLDVSKNTALTYLSCGTNQLNTLDISKNTELTRLDCYNNQLTTLDVSKNTALASLNCYHNQLTTLNVSKNTELTGLGCDNNQLTTLDVSKNTALTWLWCGYNQLTTLDLTGLNSLTSFVGSNQTPPAFTLSGNSTAGYTCAIALNTPTFGNSAISYSGGIIKSADNTVTTTTFTAQTGQTGKTLSGTLSFIYPGTTAIAETLPATSNIKIYPNPVKNELYLVGAYGIRPDKTSEIVDTQGRIVAVETLHATSLRNGTATINVSNLPQGVYFIKIETEKGIVTEKFVKE